MDMGKHALKWLGPTFGVIALAAIGTWSEAPARATPAREGAVERLAEARESALLQSLPGFRSAYADVAGARLHYVVGGEGEPLVLLPGWPETWWSFHKILPTLAEHYTVIDVELRGMGGSSKPADGYDKKTMANDIYELVQSLGYDKVDIAGHDIGSAVAFAYAANYPQATGKLVMMELPHPDAILLSFPLVPPNGAIGDKIDPAHPYLWWFAANQVPGLPEELLAGRIRVEQDWLFRYLLLNDSAIDARDRAVYEHAYNSADAIRASNGWYRTFTQDATDGMAYSPLQMPVLAMGDLAFVWMEKSLATKAANLTAVHVVGGGHFIQEEQPELVAETTLAFLQAP